MPEFLDWYRLKRTGSRFVTATKAYTDEAKKRPQDRLKLEALLSQLQDRRAKYIAQHDSIRSKYAHFGERGLNRLFEDYFEHRDKLLKQSSVEQMLMRNPPVAPSALAMPRRAKIGAKPLEFKDIKGEPSYEDVVRVASQEGMRSLDSFITSGRPVDADTWQTYTRIVANTQKNILLSNKDAKGDIHYSGLASDVVKADEPMKAEFLTLYSERATELLAEAVGKHFGTAIPPAAPMAVPPPPPQFQPNMPQPANVVAETQRRALLIALKMDPNLTLTPLLVDVQQHLVDLGENDQDWQLFMSKLPPDLDPKDAEELRGIAVSNYRIQKDVAQWKNWTEEEDRRLEGKDGDAFRSKAKGHEYRMDWNKRMKEMPAVAKTVASPVIAALAAGEAVAAAPGRLDDKAVQAIGAAIHTRITDAFENKPATADAAKTAAMAAITAGHQEIEQRADRLSVAAAVATGIYRSILSKDLITFATGAGTIGAYRGAPGPTAAGIADEIAGEVFSVIRNLRLELAVRTTTRDAVRAAIIAAAQRLNRPADLRGNDSILIARAKAGIAAAGAVASAVALAIHKTANQALIAQVGVIAATAAAEVDNGSAAVAQAIRNALLQHAPGPQADHLIQSLSDAALAGLVIQKGQTAVDKVWSDAGVNASERMVTAGVSQAVAEEITAHLTTHKTVDQTAAKIVVDNAFKRVNVVANVIYNGVQTAAENKGGKKGRELLTEELAAKVGHRLVENYYNGGVTNFTTPRIARIINDVVKEYNNGPDPYKIIVKLTSQQLRGFAEDMSRKVTAGYIDALPNLIQGPRDGQPDHLQPRSGIVEGVVEAYNVSAKIAEESAKAIEAEAGSDKVIAAAAKAVVVGNGRGDVLASAAGDKDRAEAAIIEAHPHDRIASAASIAAGLTTAFNEYNDKQLPTAHIPLVIVKDVVELYTENGGLSDAFRTYLFDFYGNVPAINVAWDAIQVSLKIQQGIEVSQQAKMGADHPEMAAAMGGVASGLGLRKAAVLEVSRQISKEYKAKNEKIDDATARRFIKQSVLVVKAKAHAIDQKAAELAAAPRAVPDVPNTGGLGLAGAAAAAIGAAIGEHYLNTNEISLTEVTRIVHANLGGAQAPSPETIAVFHKQILAAADQAAQHPVEPLVPVDVPFSLAQENALVKMAVAFSEKTDPAATGSRVAAAAVELSDDSAEATVTATVVGALAARGAGQRDSTQPLDLADVGNSSAMARAGLEAAKFHVDRIGSAAAAAAVAATSTTLAEFNNLNNILLQGIDEPGSTAKAALGILATRPAVPAPALNVAYTAALGIATAVSEAVQRVEGVAAQDPRAETVKGTVLKAALKATAYQTDPLPDGVQNHPAATEGSVAKAVAVAGAVTIAAMNMGCDAAQAEALGLAAADPAAITGGADGVEKAIRAYIGDNLALSREARNEIIQAGRSGLAIQSGIGAGTAQNAPVAMGDKAEAIVKKAARVAGATREEAAAAGADAKAAVEGLTGVGAQLTAAQAKKVSLLATASLVKISKMGAAFAAAAALTSVLGPANQVAKNQAVSQSAGATQVKEEERELPERPEGFDKTKKRQAGQVFTDDEMRISERDLRQERAKLKAKSKSPELTTVDTSKALDTGNNLDATHANFWRVTYTSEDGDQVNSTLGEEFPEVTELLQQCCKGDKNFTTAETLLAAIREFNKNGSLLNPKTIPEDQIKGNGKGGIRVSLGGLGKSDIDRLLRLWVKHSKAEMDKVDVSRPEMRKDEPPSARGLGGGPS